MGAYFTVGGELVEPSAAATLNGLVDVLAFANDPPGVLEASENRVDGSGRQSAASGHSAPIVLSRGLGEQNPEHVEGLERHSHRSHHDRETTPLRILVTGARRWPDRGAVWHELDERVRQLPPKATMTVVHGACYEDETGADWFAHEWCRQSDRHGTVVVIEEPHAADWDRLCDPGCRHTPGRRFGRRFCRRAGFIRNQEMVDLGADQALGFPLGKSSGTRHCMGRALAAGIPVREVGLLPGVMGLAALADGWYGPGTLAPQPGAVQMYRRFCDRFRISPPGKVSTAPVPQEIYPIPVFDGSVALTWDHGEGHECCAEFQPSGQIYLGAVGAVAGEWDMLIGPDEGAVNRLFDFYLYGVPTGSASVRLEELEKLRQILHADQERDSIPPTGRRG